LREKRRAIPIFSELLRDTALVIDVIMSGFISGSVYALLGIRLFQEHYACFQLVILSSGIISE
jgi:hypothetical protein